MYGIGPYNVDIKILYVRYPCCVFSVINGSIKFSLTQLCYLNSLWLKGQSLKMASSKPKPVALFS